MSSLEAELLSFLRLNNIPLWVHIFYWFSLLLLVTRFSLLAIVNCVIGHTEVLVSFRHTNFISFGGAPRNVVLGHPSHVMIIRTQGFWGTCHEMFPGVKMAIN